MSWDDTDTEKFPDMSEKKHDALADQRWQVKDRIKTLEAERDSLLHLLATERDAFGKRETELKAELEKTKDHCEKTCMVAPIEGARHWVSQEAYDALNARAGRMEKALKKIAEFKPVSKVDTCEMPRMLAKAALSEDGGK